MQLFTFLVSIVCMNIVVLTGIVGNILTFIVLQRDKQRRATHFILSSLSVFDTIFLITSYFFQSVPLFINEDHQPSVHRVFAFCGPFIYMLGHANRMMRNWTVVLVSLERFIAAVHPLRAIALCTRSNARIAVTAIISLCTLYNFPRFFEMQLKEGHSLEGHSWQYVQLNATNISHKHQIIFSKISIDKSDLARSPLYHYLYKYAGYCIFVIGTPVVLLTIFNTCVIISVKSSHKRLITIQKSASRVDITKEVVSGSDGNNGSNEQPKERLISTASQFSCRMITRSGKSSMRSARSASITPSHTSSADRRSSCRPKSQRELRSEQTANELTRVCIVILLCYTICELPPLAFQIVSPLTFEGSGVLNSYLQPLSVLFATLNSSAHFM